MGLTKEQLINSIILVKQYIDGLSYDAALPENIEKVNEALQALQPLQYIGTDANNKIGLHYFPQNTAAKTGLSQTVALAVKNDSVITVDVDGTNTEKFIIQVYKYIAGESDIVEIVKEFNNADKDNFVYSDNVSFAKDNCSICNSYKFVARINSSSQLYESDEIIVSDFKNISKISIM